MRRIYRSRVQGYGLVVWAVFLTLICLPAIVDEGNLALGLVLLAYWPFALRCGYCKVVTDPTGLVSITPFGRRTLRWEEIDSFTIGRSGVFSRVALAHLKSGETVRMWSIQGANPLTRPKPGQAGRAVADLNDELLAHRPNTAEDQPASLSRPLPG